MNPYEVLGVAPDASTTQIRRAYMELARRHHPDLRGQDASTDDAMKAVNAAWETLSDARSRAALDRRLAARRAVVDPQADAATRSRPDAAEDAAADLDGTLSDFESDEGSMSAGSLPTWMRLGAPASFVAGLLSLVLGLMIAALALARLGLMLLVLSGVLFILSPFVVLVRSRGGATRR